MVRKIRPNSSFRALLTDLLPYETPLIFSNESFHEIANSKSPSFASTRIQFPTLFAPSDEPKEIKPYDYKIAKGNSDTRILSILHPHSQLRISEFIQDFDAVILHYCKKSNFSLRYPSDIEKLTIIDDADIDLDDDETEIDDEEDEHLPEGSKNAGALKNYFKYERFDYIHKYYSSKDFLRTERRYSTLNKLDISRCFYSIYTHTIAWATKGVEYGKKNRKKEAFESKFDVVIREGNAGVTNGIIVGPEISRVFAEIILQEVDRLLQQRLKAIGIEFGEHYEIRRYIDDYFVYTNNTQTFKSIQHELKEILRVFKLHLNEVKAQQIDRPFVTNISVAKMQIRSVLSEAFISLESSYETDPPKHSNKIRSIKLINAIKGVLNLTNVKYHEVASYASGSICRRMRDILRLAKKKPIKPSILLDDLETLIDVVFFLFLVDPRVRMTVLLAKFLSYTDQVISIIPKEQTHEISKLIEDELRKSIEIVSSQHIGDGVELANLLVIARHMPIRRFSPQFLEKCFLDGNGELRQPTHFIGTSILYYTAGKPEYKNVVDASIRYAKNTLSAKKAVEESAEAALVFVDYCSCPYVSKKIRKEIIMAATKITNTNNQTISEVYREFENALWFIDWRKSTSLRTLVAKMNRRDSTNYR